MTAALVIVAAWLGIAVGLVAANARARANLARRRELALVEAMRRAGVYVEPEPRGAR